MENASKALIMAASVLLGIMIISIGVTLFKTFSDFGNATYKKIEEDKIAEWNSNYLKYYGTVTTKESKNPTPIQVTAHDIVSVANLAKQNNINYELENLSKFDENSYYVQVDVDKEINFEKKTEQEKNDFLKNNSLTSENEVKYYVCKEVKISSVTKRVMYIRFETKK